MLRAEPVEELLRVRTAGLREQDLATELRQQVAELLGVARLVEQVGAENEIPRRGTQQRFRLAPAHPSHPEEDAVALRVLPQQLDRVLGPVGGQHLGATERRGQRRESEPAAKLERAQPMQVAGRQVPRESEAARPELGPVRQELLLVERRLVDQLVGTGRPEDLEAPAVPELDLLLDELQSAANRSTGMPSGSRSCA